MREYAAEIPAETRQETSASAQIAASDRVFRESLRKRARRAIRDSDTSQARTKKSRFSRDRRKLFRKENENAARLRHSCVAWFRRRVCRASIRVRTKPDASAR